MRDKDLYAAILGIQLPWRVTSVALDPNLEEVRVVIEAVQGTRFPCPQCQEPCPGYDTRRRAFRHLDTCQFKTILEADVPRVQCSTHGVLQISVPWAEPNSEHPCCGQAHAQSAYVRALLPRLAREVGIDKRVHAHALRHTFACELMREGLPINLIQKQLGHANLAVTSRDFQHVTPPELVDAMQRRAWPSEAAQVLDD